MNYGNEPTDQIVRFVLDGTEMALKLTGAAAKNFLLFVYAVLKDQKKVRGKTRLVRMLREQRGFKFFNVPMDNMKEFAQQARGHGLLYVPIRNKKMKEAIEVVVFADDASKVQRIYDNLGLDFVKAEAGSAAVEKAAEQEKQPPAVSTPSKTETIQTDQGAVEFEVGGLEDDFNIGPAPQVNGANFTTGREQGPEKPSTEKNPSGLSSPSSGSSPGLTGPERAQEKPSVKQQLKEIKQEQAEKKAEKAKRQEHQHPAPGHSRQKKKKKQKGR